VATATPAIVLLTLPIFTISEDQNSTFSLFETFGKKFAEPKMVARVNVKKIKAKKLKKGF
jgi:hypothetical protein